jgi:phosphoglycolate phosphatase
MLQERVFPHFKIPDIFTQIISSHDIEDQEMTKPHPHMLETIMKDQGVSPEETIFVGDARTDVLMAYNAHVIPVAVLTGHLNRKEAEELKVKHIIDNVTLIENELKNIH